MGYLDRGGDTRGLGSSGASGEHAAGTDVDDDRGEVRDAWKMETKRGRQKRERWKARKDLKTKKLVR